MTPYQAIMGGFPAPQNMGGQIPVQPMGGPFGALQGVIQRAQQIAQSIGNPQQMVQRYFPDAPAEVQGNPDALVGWLQQTGRVSPQMLQMARSMMGR